MTTQIEPELLAQVLTVLRDAVTNPAKDKATDLIEWIMDNYVDLFTLAFNHYGLGHSAVSPLFKIVARNYWTEIEDLLTDANKVLKIVSKKPECAQILYTPEGIDYLNRCCIVGYENLYNFVWN